MLIGAMIYRPGVVLLFAALLNAETPDREGVRFFETNIRPVLASQCAACHGAKLSQAQGALVLDQPSGIRKGGNSGPLFTPGDPASSLLLRALRHQDKDLKMPPGKPLAPEVVANFEAWIRMGAPLPEEPGRIAVATGQKHWAFIKPVRSSPPAVKANGWARTDIDRFILAKLEAGNLDPSKEAGKRRLIRRAHYDLTGLPPSAEEIDRFAADSRPDAYERLVDRLLASPHYGERWGRHWLDVARYADTRSSGDRYAFSYTYRDWVIRAFNEDMPYKEFLRQQLAADRIEGNSPANLAALGFLSLGRTPPKNYPEVVDDRIDVVTRGLLGITVSCARCHDHKYDPIPTQDYYSLYGILANIREPGELPLIAPPGPKSERDAVYEERLRRIKEADDEYRRRRSAEMNRFFKEHTPDYLKAARDSRTMSNTEREELVRDRQLNLHVLSRWRKFVDTEKIQLPPDSGIPELAARLMNDASLGSKAPWDVPLSQFDLVFTEGDSNNTRRFRVRYQDMLAMHAYEGAAPRAMAIENVPVAEPAHVFIRGNPNNPGVATPPHFLTCLTGGAAATFREGSARRELADAIVARENPLTARVIVNRVWMHHFGSGLVRTPSDLGTRGDRPTHPELLDYLAVRFMDEGWSLKKLHKWIMLSAVYRQDSVDNPAARKIDPENQLLWRMNRRRLDIEALRDSMLVAAGRLDRVVGGVPYSLTVIPSTPRRTVYGMVERSRMPAFVTAFDFASPDQHASMRYVTTVPQQALFLMNSSFVAEQARHLASRHLASRDIVKMYRQALGRTPTAEEKRLAEEFVGAPENPEQTRTEAPVWQYGFGSESAFTEFTHFTGDAWQAATVLPDRKAGGASTRANGGEPGDGPGHAVIRRWRSPVDGKITIEGTLRHRQDALGSGDGVRARIISSDLGELASYVANGSGAETKLTGIRVQKGHTIDFIVDGRADSENDSFTWSPVVIGTAGAKWNAAADFKGPAAEPLDVWERLAQVLLTTNEFAFVD